GGKRIYRSRPVIFVLLVAYLNFIAMMHAEPFVGGLIGDPDKYAGIRVLLAGLVDDPQHAVPEPLSGVPQQAHAAFSFQQAVLDYESARPYMLPSVQVPAVE